MTPPLQRVLAPAIGVVMVAAAVAPSPPPTTSAALWTAGAALAAVLVGLQFRTASTLAVLLTALTLFLSAPPWALVVTSGLCATAYLVTQPVTGTTYVAPTKATILAALGFSLIGAVAAVFPFDIVWLPVVAPFVLLAAYATAIHPYLRRLQQN